MKREIWNDLTVLMAVAEARSFTRAAAALGLSPSAVSHAMRALEARLGVRLLNRTTRSVSPTAAGEQLLTTLRPTIANLDEVVAALKQQRDRPAGRIRLSAHRTAALHAVLPRLKPFSALYPDITVEVVVDDGLVDIVAAGFDAGIRRAEVLEPDMISVRLDEGVRLAYVAAPDYLAHAGPVLTPADLLQHRCINYRYASSTRIHRWSFERGGETIHVDAPGNLIFNDVDLLLEAALAGCGLACVTEDQAAAHLRAGSLRQVLADFTPRLPPNYLYYAGRRHVPAPLRALIEALRVRPSRPHS
jgi:DNA-binding transcriptional LysR family regulator